MTPLFPLRTLVMPGGFLPLRIFESRYLDMVSCSMREDRGFVVVTLFDGAETGTDSVQFYDLGTEVRIVDFHPEPDGLLGIVTQGQRIVQVKSHEIQDDGLIVAQCSARETEVDRALPEEFDDLVQLLQKILQQLESPYSDYEPNYLSASWVSSRLTELLPLELEDKVRLMALPDPLTRCFLLRDLALVEQG